ncbi:peptidase inhibitor family I36 protein [Actinomadura kijaniata]|uniref:peptidase inhibitor family I36 protein n=1 Tax=Actinomadura kijaniata TaxID=46161 RepID=UPI003F1CE45B
MRRRRIIAPAVAASAVASCLTVTTPAHAAPSDCPLERFCAWTETNFTGARRGWSLSDAEWPDPIRNQDSSWANHLLSAPGVPAHVRVFNGPDFGGQVTICLAPGQEVAGNTGAGNKGESHRLVTGC